MTSSLMWKPVEPEADDYFDTAVKFALRKRYGGCVDCVLSSADIPYLEGLRDGGVTSAQEVIDAIEKHGAIHVKEVF